MASDQESAVVCNKAEDILNQAIGLIKKGQKKTAGSLLASIVETNPKNDMAWFYLSSCVELPDQKEYCFKRALEINPDNQQAQKGLISGDIIPGNSNEKNRKAISTDKAHPISTARKIEKEIVPSESHSHDPKPELVKAQPLEVAQAKPHLAKSLRIGTSTDYWYQNYSGITNASNHSADHKTPIETNVVGVTYEGRQSIVALLKVGEKVLLVREPNNPHDNNAIKVIRQNGQCFGFISRSGAASLASRFDEYGKPVEAIVKSITGGNFPSGVLGVKIQFNVP